MFEFPWISPLLFLLVSISSRPCSGADTLVQGQSIVPGQTIVSQGRIFELGFFAPGNSTNSNRYVGIWYANITVQTVVWVANRDGPIRYTHSNNSHLDLVGGNLNLYAGSEVIWAAYAANVTEAVLLDSGNFVLRNDSGVIWQSFDYPTDTWLPGGKVGYNRITGAEARLVSWKNPSDPAPGVFSVGMDPNGRTAEIFMTRNSSEIILRSGVWQDGQFPSFPHSNFTYVSRDDTFYFVYNFSIESSINRIQLGSEGVLRFFIWTADKWFVFVSWPVDFCQAYNQCGANAICDIGTAPACTCLGGFMPNSMQDWSSANFSGGCVRRQARQLCGSEVRFFPEWSISLPANPELLAVGRSDICQYACSVNCTCNAFAYSIKRGCSMFTNLLDMQRRENSSDGVDLFIKMEVIARVDSSGTGNKNVLPMAIALPSAAALLICCSCSCYFWQKRKQKASKPERPHQNLMLLELGTNGPSNKLRSAVRTDLEDGIFEYELPTFSFDSIVAATDNFSSSNKLGEGGFGPVYKAELFNGQLVAVKRLSTRSGQGLEEFRNETELFAKLQHRNLVGILGCCIEKDEKILVYEYMPNKSLDFFLFGDEKHKQLDWGTRVQIIEGISQGLLYLHQYSRFRIIHRDLKASNILLDGDMNPKISDFGLARIFGGNKVQANTNRIVGTYGYMSPEYAMEGLFSIKSDVFAFGVLLLEVVNGRRNTGFYGSESLSLLGHAWNLWINDNIIELVDPRLEIPSCSSFVPRKYIHIGLLCVQESPADRPTMVDVVAMLNSTDSSAFASPRYPAFTVGRRTACKGKLGNVSINGLTVSTMEPR